MAARLLRGLSMRQDVHEAVAGLQMAQGMRRVAGSLLPAEWHHGFLMQAHQEHHVRRCRL